MIAANTAKPWLTLQAERDSRQPDDATTGLLQTLLQRGFPVSLKRQSDDRILLKTASDELDVTALSADEVVMELESRLGQDRNVPPVRPWKPWFPVIDMDRCTNCMQCLSFCLFDVYGVTADKKITVQNEDNCKTDCPACSRVCPEVAIMFPKYKAGPINGDEVSNDDVRREGMKVDISALLGGDIYAMLKDRSAKAKSRFSAERDDDRALRERERCLKKLKSLVEGLDIPDEVLRSLPSDEMIRAKAEASRATAD